MSGKRVIDNDMSTVQEAGLCAVLEIQVVIRYPSPPPSLVDSSDYKRLTPSSAGTTSDWRANPPLISPHTSDFESDFESSDSDDEDAPEID